MMCNNGHEEAEAAKITALIYRAGREREKQVPHQLCVQVVPVERWTMYSTHSSLHCSSPDFLSPSC